MIQFQPGQENQNYSQPAPVQNTSFQFNQPFSAGPKPTRDQFKADSIVGDVLFQDALKAWEGRNLNAQGQNNLARYMDPNQAGQLLIPANERGLAQLAGLELGKTITGQNIQQTGGQIQDILRKQLGLTEQGSSNPITAAMQGNKAQAIAATNQDLARAGVKGGAASAARLQTSRKMDRDIAAQAYQQYQDAIGQSRQMLGGIASAQLAPMYQAEQANLAANTPQFEPQKQTLWSFLGF